MPETRGDTPEDEYEEEEEEFDDEEEDEASNIPSKLLGPTQLTPISSRFSYSQDAR